MDEKTKQTIGKIADRINHTRREELLTLYKGRSDVWDYIKRLKTANDRVGRKGYRKVASMPLEVDRFFSKVYGKDYYKDPDFFTKHAPEWAVFEGVN